MAKTWVKSSIGAITIEADGSERKRTFNNIRADAADEKIATFGNILSTLTGQPTSKVQLTSVNSVG
ncbi:hypothetical protein [Liquorilactobacillus satsumensis]|uniref:DUF1659 domain-containing protein n=1 Tax=Liquorilactobacillus satsumensis TaxID=259059 RepID=UPI001E29E21D|nr:hypothetical protein [Liquorilactobacillus satsumensis]MCC7666397.1 hypothetical protein [Liquorilactobacillus satsumensis]MCP9358583.1 hypothetical protein [Liquorilactobacillus satsumensis]MCP9372542.1 hypothetical protein [Liquorilactobacillus satsumensis]